LLPDGDGEILDDRVKQILVAADKEGLESVPTEKYSSEEDPTSYDLYLDLGIDPESEELEDVNDEMWASTLLFFIGKEPREKPPKGETEATTSMKEASPSPRPQQESASQKVEKKVTKRMRRRRGHFPKATTDLLKGWLFDHMDHPYPTEEEKVVV
jgi:hypothetical protein